MTNANATAPTNSFPATPKQIAFARKLALRNRVTLPWDVQQDRHNLSRWIDRQVNATPSGPHDPRPSPKQAAFAERIARIKRRSVPDECHRSRDLMSRWIDANRL